MELNVYLPLRFMLWDLWFTVEKLVYYNNSHNAPLSKFISPHWHLTQEDKLHYQSRTCKSDLSGDWPLDWMWLAWLKHNMYCFSPVRNICLKCECYYQPLSFAFRSLMWEGLLWAPIVTGTSCLPYQTNSVLPVKAHYTKNRIQRRTSLVVLKNTTHKGIFWLQEMTSGIGEQLLCRQV